jgi:hypothetical protein
MGAAQQPEIAVRELTENTRVLIGWLLVMKKRVLECNACQAVVNAS